MKSIKLSLLLIMSLAFLNLFSCKKETTDSVPTSITFDIPYSVTMKFPDTVKQGSPVTIPTPNVNTDAAKQFEKNNTNADLVKSASLKELKMTIISPDTGIDFNVKNSADMSFPASSNINTPATIPIPDFLTQFSQEIPNYSLVTQDLKEILLQELKFTIPSTESSDFSFLKTINVYIQGSGLSKVLIAGKDSVPDNNSKVLILDNKNENLAPHFKSTSYSISTEVILRKVINNPVSSKMDFSLLGKAGKIQTFSFLNLIELYISGANLSEKLMASKTNIPNTIGKELLMDSKNVDFAPYIKGTSYGIRSVTTTDELIGTDIQIKIDLTFTVSASPL